MKLIGRGKKKKEARDQALQPPVPSKRLTVEEFNTPNSGQGFEYGGGNDGHEPRPEDQARQNYNMMRQQQLNFGGLSKEAQMKMVNTLWNTPMRAMPGLSLIPNLQRLPLSMMTTIYNPQTLEDLCKVRKRGDNGNGYAEYELDPGTGQVVYDENNQPMKKQAKLLGFDWTLNYAWLGRSVEGLAFTLGVGVALEQHRPEMPTGERNFLGGPV